MKLPCSLLYWDTEWPKVPGQCESEQERGEADAEWREEWEDLRRELNVGIILFLLLLGNRYG